MTKAAAAQYGELWDSSSETPYWFDGSRQGWFASEESLELRIAYAREENIGGIGFWALHYDDGDADLWQMVRDGTTDETSTDEETDPGTPDVIVNDAFDADAGRPFLAYVGDTVVLSAEQSTGPDGTALSYTWQQISGPAVALDNPASATPSFQVTDVGTLTFSLVVGDGSEVSAPDHSFVIVIDPDAGNRHGGCGCASQPGAPWTIAFLPLLLVFRRRIDV